MDTKTSFYNTDELNSLGLRYVGKNVLISHNACFYYPQNIKIGNNVRIDDFCILSGQITIGNYVHISAYVALYGKSIIQIGDFSGLSPRVTIFSESDDFSGNYMIGPMVQVKNRRLIKGPVIIKDFVQVGSNTVIMPNLTINQGAAIGACSLVNSNIDEWTINVGIPAKFKKIRNRNLLDKLI